MQAIFCPQLDNRRRYDLGVPYHVTIRDTLARNLQLLMQANPNLDSNPKLAKAADIGIGTVSRLLNAQVDATIETVAKIAKCFELTPWQMLVPDLCPKSPPVLRVMSEAEAELFERLRNVIMTRASGFQDLDPD
jgi:transcriptional regulator with XRE-family HTH domain